MALGPNPILEKEVTAKTAVTKFRIVKKDTTEDQFSHCTAAADKSVGIAQTGGAAGEKFRVMLCGIAKVEFGGTVVQGDLLTSDGSGRAIVAAPSAGTNNRIIGVAMGDFVVNDIGVALVQPCSLQG